MATAGTLQETATSFFSDLIYSPHLFRDVGFFCPMGHREFFSAVTNFVATLLILKYVISIMKTWVLVCTLFFVASTGFASSSGVCVNSRNRDQADEVKVALSNGLLSSLETAELHTAETCRDYNKKLQELLDLSRSRSRSASSQMSSFN